MANGRNMSPKYLFMSVVLLAVLCCVQSSKTSRSKNPGVGSSALGKVGSSRGSPTIYKTPPTHGRRHVEHPVLRKKDYVSSRKQKPKKTPKDKTLKNKKNRREKKRYLNEPQRGVEKKPRNALKKLGKSAIAATTYVLNNPDVIVDTVNTIRQMKGDATNRREETSHVMEEEEEEEELMRQEEAEAEAEAEAEEAANQVNEKIKEESEGADYDDGALSRF